MTSHRAADEIPEEGEPGSFWSGKSESRSEVRVAGLQWEEGKPARCARRSGCVLPWLLPGSFTGVMSPFNSQPWGSC